MIRVILKFFVRIFTLILFRVQTYGQENIEKGKAYIMCANHTSNWDPPVLYSATKREMYMMAKQELFKNKFLYWFADKTNIFPVKRGKQDIESIKKSLKVLKENKITICVVYVEDMTVCMIIVVLITLLFAQNIYVAIVEKGFIKVNAILIMKTENICMRTVLDVSAQTK